ncbi:hypothetical protein ACOI22_03530 [Glaciecola sp. 2405UD65-10]|uniref:hypothetical protein n=1 Tax=Glaciecola sp. 2405UD65-10 TaxID=3397244 RepID=UPI003B5B5A5C
MLENDSLIIEGLIWISIIMCCPYLAFVSYRLSIPLWEWAFPIKEVVLKYSYNGKTFKATVPADSNLADASIALMEVAEKQS